MRQNNPETDSLPRGGAAGGYRHQVKMRRNHSSTDLSPNLEPELSSNSDLSDTIVVTTRIHRDLHLAAKKLAKSDGRSFANYLRRLVELDVQNRSFGQLGEVHQHGQISHTMSPQLVLPRTGS